MPDAVVEHQLAQAGDQPRRHVQAVPAFGPTRPVPDPPPLVPLDAELAEQLPLDEVLDVAAHRPLHAGEQQ